LEQYDEEYRLREQQGLSPPLAPANSSLDEEEEEQSDGGRAPREVESPTPVTMGRGGGCGASARGRRGGSRHQVISGGVRGRHGGTGGRDGGVPRALEEEEAGLLQLEVSSTSPLRP
jgi:hypothetical protein